MSREVNGSSRDERILAEVDRELRAALSISPSTDFETRVLRRVAEDAAPAGWKHGWLAAAALLVLAAGLFFALNRTLPAVDGAPAQMAQRQPDVRLPAPAHEGPAYTGDVQGPSRARAGRGFTPPVGRGFTPRQPRHPETRSKPEVIVPLNQMEAVRRLVRAANEGLVAAVPAPTEGPVEPPAEIVIAPLVIEPMPVPTIEADPGAQLRDDRTTH